MDQNWKSCAEERRTRMGKTRTQDSIMLDERETLTFLIRDKDWQDAWRNHQPCRRATITSHLFNDCESTAKFLDRLLRRSPRPALRTDQSNRRPTNQVADLVVAPKTRTWFWSQLAGLAPQRPLACDLRTRGFCFVTDSFWAEKFHVITQHHCAVLLNKGAFTRDFPCMPRSSLARPGTLLSWTVEGMIVTGKFWRASDPSCSTSRSPTSTSTTSAPSGGLCASRCCCSSASCAWSSSLSSSPATSIRVLSVNSLQAPPPTSVGFLHSSSPSAAPVANFWSYATVGPRPRASRLHVARMLRFCRAPSIAKPMDNYAPRVHQLRPLRPLG